MKLLIHFILLSVIVLSSTAHAEFIRNDSLDIVVDTEKKLTWQDNSDVRVVGKDWDDAKGYCAKLTLGGYDNWRLPADHEIMTVFELNDRLEFNHRPQFHYQTLDYYWTSSTHLVNEKGVWNVSFSGHKKDHVQNAQYHVRCIR